MNNEDTQEAVQDQNEVTDKRCEVRTRQNVTCNVDCFLQPLQ